MPYYKFLARETRSIYFYQSIHHVSISGTSFTYTDYASPINTELKYLQSNATDYSKGGLIDLPQLQGVIYTESCRTCLVDYSTLFKERGTDCKFCHFLTTVVQLEKNKFTDNSDGLSFYEQHNLSRASHFYADGGAKYII